MRAAGRTVGVVAVDPTSPFTGGAILGDRVRMQAHAGDAGVFIRSMATRGHLGGLARATSEVALVLDASGKDIVLIETVGVGQDEIDIVRTADVSVVTIVPGAGDDVQALKAGIMEIADIFVVNKADRDGADRTVASIEALLSLADVRGRSWRPPDRQDRSDDGEGCHRAAERRRAFQGAQRRGAGGAPSRPRRMAGARAAVASLPSARRGRVLAAGEFERMLDRIAARETDPYTAVERSCDGPVRARVEARSLGMKATFDHIGIACRISTQALAFYRDALGLEIEAPEEVASQRVRAHFIPLGDSALELLEATADDSPIAKFIARRGPGIITSPFASTISPRRWRAQRARRQADRRGAAARRPWLAGGVHPSRQRAWRAGRIEAGVAGA